jgi:hypothetical protein
MFRRELGIACTVLAMVSLVLLSPKASHARVPIPGKHFNDWYETRNRDRDGWLHEFNLINYFFVRATASNVLPDPSGLRGVSLGPLGSLAGSSPRVGRGETYLIEQRWIPVLSFSPFFTSGWATFRAMFEVDFGWGFGANTAGQNRGGGFNADMVNIQTKAVYAAIFPTKNASELSIQLGTQPVYDSVYNPHTTSVFDIARTGYKLAFVATDATGAAVYSSLFGKAKLAFVPISFSQPNKASDNDPAFSYAFLLQADVAYPVSEGTVVGLSYWRLQDDTQGEAFVFDGLVRTGAGSGGAGVVHGHGAAQYRQALRPRQLPGAELSPQYSLQHQRLGRHRLRDAQLWLFRDRQPKHRQRKGRCVRHRRRPRGQLELGQNARRPGDAGIHVHQRRQRSDR